MVVLFGHPSVSSIQEITSCTGLTDSRATDKEPKRKSYLEFKEPIECSQKKLLVESVLTYMATVLGSCEVASCHCMVVLETSSSARSNRGKKDTEGREKRNIN